MTQPNSRYAITLGANQSVNAIVCPHGTFLAVGTPDRCVKCDDERWTDWFEHFLDRYEAKHGSRYPIHGWDDAELREAYEHGF